MGSVCSPNVGFEPETAENKRDLGYAKIAELQKGNIINGLARCLPFVDDYRNFLMTSGLPTSDEFANLWTFSPYCANSVY